MVLREILSEGDFYGMQTFDQSLVDLYRYGLIDYNTAVGAATNPTTSPWRSSNWASR